MALWTLLPHLTGSKELKLYADAITSKCINSPTFKPPPLHHYLVTFSGFTWLPETYIHTISGLTSTLSYSIYYKTWDRNRSTGPFHRDSWANYQKFFIILLIEWSNQVIILHIMIIQSGNNFAHVTTVVLLWHVQNFDLIGWLVFMQE